MWRMRLLDQRKQKHSPLLCKNVGIIVSRRVIEVYGAVHESVFYYLFVGVFFPFNLLRHFDLFVSYYLNVCLLYDSLPVDI